MSIGSVSTPATSSTSTSANTPSATTSTSPTGQAPAAASNDSITNLGARPYVSAATYGSDTAADLQNSGRTLQGSSANRKSGSGSAAAYSASNAAQQQRQANQIEQYAGGSLAFSSHAAEHLPANNQRPEQIQRNLDSRARQRPINGASQNLGVWSSPQAQRGAFQAAVQQNQPRLDAWLNDPANANQAMLVIRGNGIGDDPNAQTGTTYSGRYNAATKSVNQNGNPQADDGSVWVLRRNPARPNDARFVSVDTGYPVNARNSPKISPLPSEINTCNPNAGPKGGNGGNGGAGGTGGSSGSTQSNGGGYSPSGGGSSGSSGGSVSTSGGYANNGVRTHYDGNAGEDDGTDSTYQDDGSPNDNPLSAWHHHVIATYNNSLHNGLDNSAALEKVNDVDGADAGKYLQGLFDNHDAQPSSFIDTRLGDDHEPTGSEGTTQNSADGNSESADPGAKLSLDQQYEAINAYNQNHGDESWRAAVHDAAQAIGQQFGQTAGALAVSYLTNLVHDQGSKNNLYRSQSSFIG